MFKIISIGNTTTHELYTMSKIGIFTYMHLGDISVKFSDKIVYECGYCNTINSAIMRTFNNNLGKFNKYGYLCAKCSKSNKHLNEVEIAEKYLEISQKGLITKTKNGTTPRDILNKTGKLGFIGCDQTKGSDIRNKINITKKLNNSNTNVGTEAYLKRKETYNKHTKEKKESIRVLQNITKNINGSTALLKYNRGERFGFINMSVEDRNALSKYIDQILKTPDDKGITGYQYANRKRVKIMKSQGKLLNDDELSDFALYKRKVWQITNSQDLNNLTNFDKRGRADLTENAYHLDHRVSIKYGFQHNIPVYIIGNILNLEMIPHKINSSKQDKCSVEIETLTTDVIVKNGELLETTLEP